MPRWDFRSATNISTRGPTVTLARVAARFDVQLATIARARIDTQNRRPAQSDCVSVVGEDGSYSCGRGRNACENSSQVSSGPSTVRAQNLMESPAHAR